MGQSLKEIAEHLKRCDKKVQLIYAFNGTGKTRLSREFKNLIAPKAKADEEMAQAELARDKILYYNAFTEDLFYWDNDLENDAEPKLKVQPNSFTDWLLKNQGKDRGIASNFQHYGNNKLTPYFSEDFSEVTFSIETGDDKKSRKIKISKGEESNFIWSIFYTLLEEVVDELNKSELEYDNTNPFHNLEYIFIDDPVSSLDENNLIELAVKLAKIITDSAFDKNKLKFIVTTHNPLFYNVLFNEINKKTCYLFSKNEDGTFEIEEKQGDSNRSFSYHLHLIKTIKEAIENNNIEKYHFMLLRNLYEKSASFLGYQKWSDLLPKEARESYLRYIQFFSHKDLSAEEVREPAPHEKQIVNTLLKHLIDNYNFWQEANNNE